MIKLLVGKKGTGKTKVLLEKVNECAASANGNVVFISNDTGKNMYDIKSSVRMADTSEFDINTWDEFIGFIFGIVSGNFDITDIFVDGTLKIVANDLGGFEKFLTELEKAGEKFNINFMLSISMDAADVPEYAKKYI